MSLTMLVLHGEKKERNDANLKVNSRPIAIILKEQH